MKLVSKGDVLQRVFQVVNQGSGTARNMQAILNIPNGYTYKDATVPVGYIKDVSGTKVWFLGDQPSGAVHAIDLYMEVSDDCALGAEMNIYVKSDSPDPNIANNLLQFNLPWIGCCEFKSCFDLDKDIPERDLLKLSDFAKCHVSKTEDGLIINTPYFVSDQSDNNKPETYNGPIKSPTNPMDRSYVVEYFADGIYWWKFSCTEDPETNSYSLQYFIETGGNVYADLYINASDNYLESAVAATPFVLKPANSSLGNDFTYDVLTGILTYTGDKPKRFRISLSIEAYFTDNGTAPIELQKNDVVIPGLNFAYIADGSRSLFKTRSRVILLSKDDELKIVAEASVTNDYEFYELNLTISEA